MPQLLAVRIGMATSNDHERFMMRCIELANIAFRNGNTPVGSIVVIGGEIVGEGIEQLPSSNNLTGHAEILACQDAVNSRPSIQFNEATLYTTAEPCFMCSYVIRQSGFVTVVYGRDTPLIGGVTSEMPILTDPRLCRWMPPPRIIAGVLQAECERLSRS